ncbi:MAG TPA: nuclear transport factor 2 family protein [Gaiellaceae bacterium]
MDVDSAARAWAQGWARAWRATDPDAVAELYADDCVFRSHPFREPHLGRAGAREYAARAFAAEEGAPELVRFGEPIAETDAAAVEYWAVVRERGQPVTIAGIAVLRFGDDGLVREQHDYWALEPGAREPWDGWGRFSS